MLEEKRTTWIVVADGGNARILQNQHREEAVTELPLVSGHDPRLVAHGGGQAGGVHHEPVFKPSPERRREDQFLNQLAETLQTAIARKECEELVLVAPASALGLLRKALNSKTYGHVVAEIVHDYTHQTNEEVWQHVRPKLPI
jgi:protein required for attachment to host cells